MYNLAFVSLCFSFVANKRVTSTLFKVGLVNHRRVHVFCAE